MEDKIILLDTSVLIEYFRKKDKSKTKLVQLADYYSGFHISVITEYEIYTGAVHNQADFWNDFLAQVRVIPFDTRIAQTAVTINNELKRKRKQIDIADLFIAATAITHNMPIASLNRRHFERIEELQLID